jgi:hypothetical protein
MAGGWNDAQVDDSIKEIAQWSAAQLGSLTQEKHQVVEIKNVQTQVVSGIKYKFTLELLVDGKVSHCYFFNIKFCYKKLVDVEIFIQRSQNHVK